MPRNRKIWSALIAVSFLLFAGSALAGSNENATVSLDLNPEVGDQALAEMRGVGASEEISLEIYAHDVVNLSGFRVKVGFDTAAVSFVEKSDGTLVTEYGAVSLPALVSDGLVDVGTAILGATEEGAPEGDILLVTLKFLTADTFSSDQETELGLTEVMLASVPFTDQDLFTEGLPVAKINPPGPALAVITVSPDQARVAAGGTQEFTAAGEDDEGNPVDIGDLVVWEVDPEIGTIEAVGATATLTAATTAGVSGQVRASVGDVVGIAEVTIKPGPAVSVTVSPEVLKVAVIADERWVKVPAGQAEKFIATGEDEYGNSVDVRPIWRAAPEEVGAISMATGMFTAGEEAGVTGSIEATAMGITASIAVEIVAGRLARIIVEPAMATVNPGESITFTATGVDEFGNEVRPFLPIFGVIGPIGTISPGTGIFTAGDEPGEGFVVAFASPWIFGGTTATVQAAAKVTVRGVPEKFSIGENYPNPFNAETTINYSLPGDGVVSIVIYDAAGQEIVRLADGVQRKAGYHKVRWDGRNSSSQDVGSGVYFYKVEARIDELGNFVATKKMTLLR